VKQKKRKDKNMSFIVVEIPHEKKVQVWVAHQEQDIIEAAQCERGQCMTYEELDMDDFIEIYGPNPQDLLDIPKEALDILNNEGKLIKVDSYGLGSQYFKLDEAPSKLEAAKECLFDDLHSGFVLSKKEARRFISKSNDIYAGHQCREARQAVRESMQFI
jgi:hypothetical protein